jgi:putative ABC transport system substrate-binding protein
MTKRINTHLLFMVVLLTGSPAHPQPPAKAARIGLLGRLGSFRVDSFRGALRDLGYIEGKNIVVEYRDTLDQTDDLRAPVAELLKLGVDVIVTLGTNPTQAVKNATHSIPIVMTNVADPVGYGFIESLARPGGNITGLTNFGPELSGKRLELLKEVFPKTSRVAIFWNRMTPVQSFLIKEMQAPAATLGITLLPWEILSLSPAKVGAVFEELKKARSDALMVLLAIPKPFVAKTIVQLALKHRLPSTYHWEEYVESGGLMYYGPYLPDTYRRAAAYVDRILEGAKPAELPVEQPTHFDLVINLKTAKALALKIPAQLLMEANRVIE